MTNVVIDNFKFLNDKGIGVLKEIAKELNIKSLHLYTTKNKLELINLITEKEPIIEKTQSPPKKVFKCKDDEEINPYTDKCRKKCKKCKEDEEERNPETGRCRKICKDDEKINHKGICIKSPKTNDKSPKSLKKKSKMEMKDEDEDEDEDLNRITENEEKTNIVDDKSPFENLTSYLKFKILANLSESSMKKLLSTNKEIKKEINDETKEIKKDLNRIITQNEGKINNLINEIYNDRNNWFISGQITKKNFKNKFIIDYNNNALLNWDFENIYIDSLDLSSLFYLRKLPESFGKLIIAGDLDLHDNNFTELPESFGNLKIGGNLNLNQINISKLPESFGKLIIKGSLDLSGNFLKSLPKSFGNLTIGGSLDLSKNELKSLPESFGSLVIKGNLNLESNQLELLPESFGKLVIGGQLSLAGNFGELTNRRLFNRTLNSNLLKS